MCRIFILLLMSLPMYVFPQKYVVSDMSNNRIADVIFSNKKTVVLSNDEGIVDLSVFEEDETITTSHISFLNLSFSKRDVLDKNILLISKGYDLREIKIKENLNVEDDKTKLIKINNKKILSSFSMNPAELLEKSTPITIQKSQAGGGSPNIRGFEANRILLILDGIKLNNTIYRSGHLQNILSVDPYILDNLSVLHGPSSVFYGSGALGGAIVMNTINPEIFSKNNNLFIQQYETSSSSTMSHVHSIYKVNDISFLSSISVKKYGNIHMGKNRLHGYENWGIYQFATSDQEQLFGEYNQIDLTQKIHFPLKNNSSFSLLSQFSSTSNINRFDKLNDVSNNLPKYKSWYYGPQKRFLHSLNYTSFKKSKLFDKINSSISFQHLEESRVSQLYVSDNIIKRFEEINLLDLKTIFIKYFGLLQIRYGFSNRFENLQSTAYAENENSNLISYAATRYPENGSECVNVAGFLLSEYKLSNNLSWFTGLRYDYDNIIMNFSDNNLISWGQNEFRNNNSDFSFSSNLSFNLSKNNFLSLSIFNAFRSPNVDDLGKIFSKNSGIVVVPNPNLKSEKIISYEIMFSNKSKSRSAEFSFFYSNLKDAIQKRKFILHGSDSIMYDGEMMMIIANTNIQRANMSGFNISINQKLSNKLDFSLYSSYIQGKSSDDLPLSHIPPLSIRSSFDFKLTNKSNIVIYSNYNGSKKYEDFDLNGVDNLEEATIDGTPSWYTINLSYSKKIQNILFSISCENIFDVHYKTFASGISSNGRNFILNLQSNL